MHKMAIACILCLPIQLLSYHNCPELAERPSLFIDRLDDSKTDGEEDTEGQQEYQLRMLLPHSFSIATLWSLLNHENNMSIETTMTVTNSPNVPLTGTSPTMAEITLPEHIKAESKLLAQRRWFVICVHYNMVMTNIPVECRHCFPLQACEQGQAAAPLCPDPILHLHSSSAGTSWIQLTFEVTDLPTISIRQQYAAHLVSQLADSTTPSIILRSRSDVAFSHSLVMVNYTELQPCKEYVISYTLTMDSYRKFGVMQVYPFATTTRSTLIDPTVCPVTVTTAAPAAPTVLAVNPAIFQDKPIVLTVGWQNPFNFFNGAFG